MRRAGTLSLDTVCSAPRASPLTTYLFSSTGLSATLIHSAIATSPATLVTGGFQPSEPCAPVALAGILGCTDLQVLGAVTADVATARFYFADPRIPGEPCAPLIPSDPCLRPNPVLPPNPVRLLYFTGTSWAPACSSGNQRVTVGATPHLDGAISAFRVSATFDSTSTPTITALTGTRFAAVRVGYALSGFLAPVNNPNTVNTGRPAGPTRLSGASARPALRR